MAEKHKLVDLKRTKAEKKDDDKRAKSSPMDSDYHYGLRLHLGDDELDKLGLKENPEVGTEHRLVAHAKVVRSDHSADEHMGERRHVEFHIHKMEPPEEIGSETKKEKSVRDDIKDSLRKQEEKSEKKGGAEEPKADDEAEES
jgi:hypothetical protein